MMSSGLASAGVKLKPGYECGKATLSKFFSLQQENLSLPELRGTEVVRKSEMHQIKLCVELIGGLTAGMQTQTLTTRNIDMGQH